MVRTKAKRTVIPRTPTQIARETEASRLLREIWGLQDAKSKDFQLYLQHFNNCTTPLSVKKDLLSPTVNDHFLDMVNIVKAGKEQSLSRLKADVLANSPPWLATETYHAAWKAIEFGATLWLMVDPTGWREDVTLREYVASLFPKSTSTLSTVPLLHEELVFNARRLHRIAGLEIVWTSLINRHLLLDSRTSRLYIFRHASMLHSRRIASEKYNSSARWIICADVNSNIYPEGLLAETAETMALLFPRIDFPRRRWDRRIRTGADVDVEAGVARTASQNLDSYIYWRERLKIIQDFYDRSKPRTLRQWVYDNRDSNQQATFWFAIIAILLTLLFGLIQSITGVLQVIRQ